MNPIDSPIETPTDVSSHSRRAMLGASATGLALALLARGFSRVAAQEATPAAEGGWREGEGVGVTPWTSIPVPETDVPTGGFNISVALVTLEPGASVPASTYPYPEMAFVQSGFTMICPGEAPRFRIWTDGMVEEVGAGDIPVSIGESIYVPPNVLNGARNDGTDTLVVLVIDLLPAEGMATRTA